MQWRFHSQKICKDKIKTQDKEESNDKTKNEIDVSIFILKK